MNPEEARNLPLNYVVNVLDGAFFGFGLGFASFSAVIPLFISTMTDSAILIGLVSAVHVMGWQIPQLITARSVASLTRYKPMVLWMTIHERIPFLGLALVALFYRQLGPAPAVILTFVMLLWQGFGAGFTANPWQNMIAKIIPSGSLATFFGMQSSASNLLASGGAIIAGTILEQQPFPNNYFLCFSISAGLLIFSILAIVFTRESPHTVQVAHKDQPPIWSSMRTILSADRNFNWFLLARTVVQFGTMAFSFYTVFAATRLNAGEYAIGILASVLMISQVIANLGLGRLADKWSRKGVLVIGALSIFLSAMIACFAPSIKWLYISMALAGMANTAFWTITMTLTLEFGNEQDRPTYVGMANTFIAPATILAPLIGGWLADSTGYPATFLFSAAAGLIAAALFLFLVKDPKRKGNLARSA